MSTKIRHNVNLKSTIVMCPSRHFTPSILHFTNPVPHLTGKACTPGSESSKIVSDNNAKHLNTHYSQPNSTPQS